MSEAASQNVSVEQNGRVLTGGPGTNIEALEQAIERTAPEPMQDAKPEPSAEKPTDSKPPTRGQARFSELTNQREAARQEAKAANDRAIALEARLKAIEERTASAGKQEVPQAEKPAPVSAPSATREKPSEAEIGTKYATMGDYFEDLSDWKLEQREHAAEQAKQHTSRLETWTAERQKAAAVYPDFDTVLASGPGASIDLSPDPETARARVEMLMTLPGGGHVVYKLATDATEAARLATLDDRAFGFAVARLLPPESNGATPASPPTPRATKAPPPYQPVQAGGKTTGMTSAEAASKGDYESYRRLRAAERGVKPKYK